MVRINNIHSVEILLIIQWCIISHCCALQQISCNTFFFSLAWVFSALHCPILFILASHNWPSSRYFTGWTSSDSTLGKSQDVLQRICVQIAWHMQIIEEVNNQSGYVIQGRDILIYYQVTEAKLNCWKLHFNWYPGKGKCGYNKKILIVRS